MVEKDVKQILHRRWKSKEEEDVGEEEEEEEDVEKA